MLKLSFVVISFLIAALLYAASARFDAFAIRTFVPYSNHCSGPSSQAAFWLETCCWKESDKMGGITTMFFEKCELCQMGNQLGAACKWSEDKQLQRGLGVANLPPRGGGVSELNSSGPASGPPAALETGSQAIRGSQPQPPTIVDCKTNHNDPSCQQQQQTPPSLTTITCPDGSQPDSSGKCSNPQSSNNNNNNPPPSSGGKHHTHDDGTMTNTGSTKAG